MINLIGKTFTVETLIQTSSGKWVNEVIEHKITKANVKNFNGIVETKSIHGKHHQFLPDVLNILGLKFEQVAQ